MKKILLPIIMVLFVGNVFATTDIVDASKGSQKYLFSKDLDESVKKLDPIAFEAALKDFGPLCKYGRAVIAMQLCEDADKIQQASLMPISPLEPQNKKPWEKKIIGVSAAIGAAGAVTLAGFIGTDASIYKKCAAGIVGVGLAAYSIYIFYWLTKQKNAKTEQEENIQPNAAEELQQERDRKLDAIKKMLTILENHPLKEC